MENEIEKLRMKNEILMEMIRELKSPAQAVSSKLGDPITAEVLIREFGFKCKLHHPLVAQEVQKGELTFLTSSRTWFLKGCKIVGFSTIQELESYLRCTEVIPLI